ncbi:MAG: hypothetical protein ACFFEV_09165, partial [Candidatus Thorarchaeota archaeon]
TWKKITTTGFEILITSCSFCVTNFNDGIKTMNKEKEETGKDLSDVGSKLVVVELLELLDELL